MHSFHPSRGRIFFEVLCALAIAASFAGAWMQTSASALLLGAAIATLYGLVHFFDLFRREPSAAVQPQRIEFEHEPVVDAPVRQNVSAQLARIEEQLTAYSAAEEAPLVEMRVSEEALPVEPVAPQPSESRRTKAPRKASSNRSPKKAKAAAPASLEEKQVVDFTFRDEQVDGDPAAAAEPIPADHPPVAPLFEPEPFVRQQQRAIFGRKSG